MINPDFQSDIISQATTEIALKISKQKDDIVNQKLIENGYPPLSEYSKRVRFPKLNVSEKDDWEYVFVDNGTTNGEFLVAFRIVYDNSFKLDNHGVESTFTLEWQDKDCSKVLF